MSAPVLRDARPNHHNLAFEVDEQVPVPGADFGLTVNTIHLTALGGTVDVVVGSATSDLHNCV